MAQALHWRKGGIRVAKSRQEPGRISRGFCFPFPSLGVTCAEASALANLDKKPDRFRVARVMFLAGR